MKRVRLVRGVAFGFAIAFASSVALSFVHPWGNLRSGSLENNPILTGASVPPDVRQVLETKCIDCHSEGTRWPTYSRVAPSSWLLEKDVYEGRKHMNLSRWQEYSRETQVDLLTKISAETRTGQMPPGRYLLLHPQTKLSPEEQQLISEWVRAERKRVRSQPAAEHQP